MPKKKTKKIKLKSKPKKEKKLKLGTFKETAREKLIGQHIGYRYDVNLLPDYKKITPFLKKYIGYGLGRFKLARRRSHGL